MARRGLSMRRAGPGTVLVMNQLQQRRARRSGRRRSSSRRRRFSLRRAISVDSTMRGLATTQAVFRVLGAPGEHVIQQWGNPKNMIATAVHEIGNIPPGTYFAAMEPVVEVEAAIGLKNLVKRGLSAASRIVGRMIPG